MLGDQAEKSQAANAQGDFQMTPCNDTAPGNATKWCCGGDNQNCCGVGATETAITFPNIGIPELGYSSSPSSTSATSPSTSAPQSTTSAPSCKHSELGKGVGIGIAIATGLFSLLVLCGYMLRKQKGRKAGRRSGAIQTVEKDGYNLPPVELSSHRVVELPESS
jgi:hypothetical protein